jgi:hypothetical protein
MLNRAGLRSIAMHHHRWCRACTCTDLRVRCHHALVAGRVVRVGHVTLQHALHLPFHEVMGIALSPDAAEPDAALTMVLPRQRHDRQQSRLSSAYIHRYVHDAQR